MAAELLCCLGSTAALCLCLVHAEVEQMHPGDFACSQLCSLFLELCCPFLKKKKAYPAGVSNACLQDLYSLQLSGLQQLVCFMPRLVLLISLDFHGCTCARLDLFSLLLMYGTCRRKKKPTKKVHFSPLDIYNVIVVKRQRLYRNLSIH